jgi:hypothetical protein
MVGFVAAMPPNLPAEEERVYRVIECGKRYSRLKKL